MSGGIRVEALTLTLGAFRLAAIEFAVSPGEILVVLGPNGAGKSLTLEALAGFHRLESGRVLIGGCDVSTLPPERRNVGFVVQNFGLFPHLSVAQNVAIARRRDRLTPPHGTALAGVKNDSALLAYFGVAHLAARMPGDLSPGEKQRVALARALAGAPDLFLFDEPFSALDAETHDQLRDELKSFLRALSIPAIFVSHDRSDAVTLADKIVVLRHGAIAQRAAAAEVLQRPANAFVARFIGIENVLTAQLNESSADSATVALGDRTLRAAPPSSPLRTADAVHLAIRAEEVRLYAPYEAPPPADQVNRLDGRVVGLRNRGPLIAVEVNCGFPIIAYLLAPQARTLQLTRDSHVAVEIAASAIHLMAE